MADAADSPAEQVARTTLLLSIEHVLDDHAELRDVLTQVHGASDAMVLRGLLVRLDGLLEAHFAREEEAGGVLRLIADRSPQHGDDVTRLVGDHRAILAALRTTTASIDGADAAALVAAQARLTTILRRLHDHDARETEILSGVMQAERSLAIARAQAAPEPGAANRPATAPADAAGRLLGSTALEVNLRRTAVDVVIPAEQMVLLDVTSGLHGLQEETRTLLREINHRYVGWAATLEDLHRHAMGTFPHYVAHERAAEAVAVYCGLYAKIVAQATPAIVGDTALRYLLYYLEKVVAQAGPRLPALLPAVAETLAHLGTTLVRTPDRAAALSPRLKALTRLLVAAPPADASIVALGFELVAIALDRVYARWLGGEDPVGWWREQTAAGAQETPPEPIAAISHARLRDARATLEALRATVPPPAALLDLPDDAEIGRRYLEAGASCAPPASPPGEVAVARVRWLTRVLSVDALAGVHEQALGAIDHAYGDVLRRADRAVVAPLVRETFAGLRRGRLASSTLAFSLVAKIGRAMLATGDEALADAVVDEILDLDFPTPGFAGFTDEWKVRVDPAHLAGIRCHLAIIETNPWLARRLLAGLVVHLKAGGVFVADTDLFQRDVSRLLDCDVGPVFHQLKHLLRTFPVYFSDIGAEGELREVSTRIDEIGGRRDRLCNFLRKQCHVESNPRLIDFVEAIGRFWATGDAAPLAPYVPDGLYERCCADGPPPGVRDVLARLAADGGPADVFAREPAALQGRLDAMDAAAAVDREKVGLLVQLHRLIVRKYGLGGDDLVERLRAFHRLPAAQVDALEQALAAGPAEVVLGILIDLLERLKEIAVDPAEAQPIEDIYHKRHIAVGIPSIYGRYREAKFEAMGLGFRIEALANVLLERLVAEEAAAEIDRATLERVARLLRLVIRALRVDGCRARQLATATGLLEEALRSPAVSVAQYADVFRLLSHSIEQLIRVRFLDVYEPVLERLLGRLVDRGVLGTDAGADRAEQIMKASERILRDLIAQSFALQPLDRLVGTVRRALAGGTVRLAVPAVDPLAGWDAASACVPLDDAAGPEPGILALGSKGYLITRLARQGFPVPPGFVLSTAYFRCHPVLRADDGLRREMADRIDEHVARLERVTGRRFGDVAEPLLLSVRSGAAISMPGVLDTFLDVGINPDIAAGLADATGSPWAAWDAYRRFLQFWGMSHGIDRDRFDALMRDAKQRHLVAKKSNLTPASMLEIALRYRALLLAHGVPVVDDPREQLHACIDMVIRSWHLEKARAYRSAMAIAEGWGTAVIVQAMVLGNLGQRSGTGVVLTCDPRRPGRDVELYGDFVVQGQGDDVVSGLVETFPISEAQRGTTATATSLEQAFPHVYDALLRHARALVLDHGMFHQEIEFTFEGERGEDLYVLQTRDMVRAEPGEVRTFAAGAALAAARAASGIGAGGGALSGRVAHTAADIAALRRRWPDDPIVLLRPDTVPDDIPLLLQVDGMVTAIGGATSHAAVAAQWLGRTCVVGCRALEVHEDLGRSTLAGRPIATGDFLSIDGNDGAIYLGHHETTVLRRQRSG